MATQDPAEDSAAHLKREMAILTAEFATEQALERLRRAVKVGRTADIVECANYAADAVTELAGVVPALVDADTSAEISKGLAGCRAALERAEQAEDPEGVLGMGELLGDAVANFASFLKRDVSR
ncbi:MAG: hypothetical protein JWQ81_8480 [Amycolatopsis sp.]|jgi:hypothetical protein|uniref:hypothetical protein n=1 Tax=Amycolatopsis sp. TaxID=37632 RepID=UPI002637E8C6|nr:hypothetical protein [Amycolatopsis sp.]MCU1687741.1 hypothetical protein [Amycolatopsis sp.]